MHRNPDTIIIYKVALLRLNHHFRQYENHPDDLLHRKTLHFTSQQMRHFPNLIKFFRNVQGPGSYQVRAEEYEKMCHCMENLKDLKVTCSGDYIVELQQFSSLKNLHLVGPSLRQIRGLSASSCHLRTLIVENGDISLKELLSQCCLDDSTSVTWPCLMSLKISNCALTVVDLSLCLLPNLEELDLSFNELTGIGDELNCLDLITHLNLGFNFIKALPPFNNGIAWSLQCLYLPYNELADLEGVQILESLKDLDISHNLLLQHGTLEPLRHLAKLENLDLRGNPLCFNKTHRELAVRCISPLAMKLEFCLDGKALTNNDLADGMYTPVAMECSQYASARPVDFSINGANVYDISMSPAANVRRLVGDVSSFRRYSSSSKRKKHATPKQGSNSGDGGDRLVGQSNFEENRTASCSIETLSSTCCHSDTPRLHTQTTFPLGAHGREEVTNATGTPTIRDKTRNAVMSLMAQRSVEGRDREAVNIIITDRSLIEIEFETGHFLDSFKYRNIQEITSLSSRQVCVTLSHPDDSVTRHVYNFPGEEIRKISQFIDMVKGICTSNQNEKMRRLVCLKCSKSFDTPDVPAVMVCSCGSSMVVDEKFIDDDQRSFTSCEESTDPELMVDERSVKEGVSNNMGVSVPGHATSNGANTEISLSWMHSPVDVPSEGQTESLLRNEYCQISSSLPAYLSDVLGPCAGSSKLSSSAVSESLMHSVRNVDAPFKSFPNLMPPHEIYKLVEVTPLSDNSGKKDSVKEHSSKSPIDGRPFTPPQSRPDSKNDNGETGDRSDHHEHGYSQQVMVTSTPRRKAKSRTTADLGESPQLEPKVLQRRRSSAFDNYGSGTSVDDDLWSHHTVSGKLPTDSVGLQQFVEEELLEYGEELMAIQKSMILRETGKALVDFVSQRSPAKGLFVRKSKLDPGNNCAYEISYVNCLILVTTANLHILDMPNTRETGPEHLHSYPLTSVVGVASGLRTLSTVIAVCNTTRERKLELEHIEIFTVVFANPDKCRKFQKQLFESAMLQWKGSNVDRSPKDASGNDSAGAILPPEESTPFSDLLERNLSENVLMYLDLSAPESSLANKTESFKQLVNVDMFTHYHCSLQNGFDDSEFSALLLIACSGSISIVYENSRLVMHTYGSALMHTNKGKKRISLQHENSLVTRRSSVTNRSNQVYAIKTTKQCSQIVSITRFANQSDYLQFNFDNNEENRWDLKFAGASSVETVLELIDQFFRVDKDATVPIIWR